MGNRRQTLPFFLVDEPNVPRHQHGYHGGRRPPVKSNVLRPCDHLAPSLPHHTGSIRANAGFLSCDPMDVEYVFEAHWNTSRYEALLYPLVRLSGIGKNQGKLSDADFIFDWVFMWGHRLAQASFHFFNGLFAPLWWNSLQ